MTSTQLQEARELLRRVFPAAADFFAELARQTALQMRARELDWNPEGDR